MKKALSLLLALAMLCTCVLATTLAFAEEEMTYSTSFEILMSNFLNGRDGKPHKVEEFAQSETMRIMIERMYHFMAYGEANQDDPAITDYWNRMGLTKEIHDADDPDRIWSIFVPNDLYRVFEEDYDAEAKFPVVFVLHGNVNPIRLAESYGFTELGGRENFITVLPWAKNEDIILEEIPRIMEVLRADYPIDESRIYAVGFSKGGMATQNVALNYPELFAAVAPGGSGPVAMDSALVEKASEYGMPVCFFGGTSDSMPLTSVDVNNWIKMSGAIAPEYTEEFMTQLRSMSPYGTERLTGMQYGLDKMEILPLDSTYYYIGSIENADGVDTFRAVAAEGVTHWLAPSYATLVWDFLSQFARDTETGELIYLNK